MNGILLIDKELNWTSFDCVAKIRSIVRSVDGKKVKVGHAGTLDPLASGLLIILVGSYTKKAEELTKKNKVYEVGMELGYSSTTGDLEGERTKISDYVPSIEEIELTMSKYVGSISQVPPIYSAIKINGVRSYKLAREGKEVEIKPRLIKIQSIDLVNYSYPNVQFTAHVSSGTYIRSLVSDIGGDLDTGAYATSIRRTSIDKFNISSAIKIGSLNKENIQDYLISDL
jgi:tRNA pseudouridine55 synthase